MRRGSDARKTLPMCLKHRRRDSLLDPGGVDRNDRAPHVVEGLCSFRCHSETVVRFPPSSSLYGSLNCSQAPRRTFHWVVDDAWSGKIHRLFGVRDESSSNSRGPSFRPRGGISLTCTTKSHVILRKRTDPE